MITDKELEEIGYIEDPQEYGPFKDKSVREYFKRLDAEWNRHFCQEEIIAK
ncbi:MAG TPA: hypothetical protein VIA09_02740 [Nitrososphaeraceae archaeon]|jgi:hypothetical protein